MDVGLAGGATWAAALGALTAFFAWLAKRTSRRESERRAYRRACDAWKEAISKGDALGAAEEKRKIGKDNFTKGLWYIREILNCMIFPGDRQKNR